VNNASFTSMKKGFAALASIALLAAASSSFAANVVILNGDDPGVGFNDTTPAAPVGGNPGTTVGAQRLNAMNYVAQIWGRTLTGTGQTIEVLAGFLPLGCEGTLAGANAWQFHRDFAKAPFKGTWYHAALGNKLTGIDIDVANNDPAPEAFAIANVDLDRPDCLPGVSWYYGLDGKAPPGGEDFVRVMLHELGHGLGFATATDEATGEYLQGFPHVWDHFLYDNTQNRVWTDMTVAQRQTSALNNEQLVWRGFTTFVDAQRTLKVQPQLDLFVSGASQLSGFVVSAIPNFGLAPGSRRGSGLIAFTADAGTAGDACAPFDAALASKVRGKIAIINRGDCAIVDKVLNAQNAGARGVVLIQNVPTFFRFSFPSVRDDSVAIRIPAAMISQQDGAKLRASAGTFTVVSFLDLPRRAGADLFGRPQLFAPTANIPGSSVSHWNVTASPNLLMEPFAEGDESITLRAPADLTMSLFKDIGW
jgi:PA domain